MSFDRGVTAIVGPNGCGKSNVADAITWVLGEQSAKSLRGDRMEDVIFNGSDARKPTGAAEVRLRLSVVLSTKTARRADRCNATVEPLEDDTAVAIARTVEVTRRLYRSGESEYLIDGEVCRLRDVHELLMDTGLGAKAYAIIEQGKIGMILSSRPTDRRQLIEEAAGITKYKARRRAAELKLEAAQQNLTRLEDIIFELEKQFGSLKRQSAKARRYKRLRDELRHWEKLLFAGRYQEVGEDRIAARASRGHASARRAAPRVAGARPISAASASRSWRPKRARQRARGGARAASWTSTGVSSRSSSTASSCALAARAEEVAPSWRRSRRAASPAARCRWRAAAAPRREGAAGSGAGAAIELERIEAE